MIQKEEGIEDLICEALKEIGYIEYKTSFNIEDLTQVIDFNLLKESLIKINRNLDIEYINEAINKIKKINLDFIEGNIKTLDWLKNGIDIKIDKISNRFIPILLVDYINIENNSFRFIRQMEISSGNCIRRLDIIIYLNGLPISIIEVKSPEAKESLNDAYNQIKHYTEFKPSLMYWNVLSMVSNAYNTRYGAISSNYNHWWSWKKVKNEIEQDIDDKEDSEGAMNNYHKNIVGLYDKEIFLNILKNYIFYAISDKYTKYIPTYYQYNAVENALRSLELSKDNKGGVVWHTQGSGKSVTMLFLTSRIKSHFKEKNYKIILITDRNELDDQLYTRFCQTEKHYLYVKPRLISSRNDLKNVLSDDDDFGIYMTTIQKFTKSDEPLSNKDNIIIIADEAHRSHNNIETDYEINKETEEIVEKEGYAKYMRYAFPKAKFIGFTGTPLMGNKKTIEIFGDYIDKYTMSQAVLDGSTVPIFYEKRKIEILLDKIKSSDLDKILNEEKEMEESEYINNAQYNHIRKKLINISNILSDPDIIEKVVLDFWEHYDNRKRALHGKAMFVAFNRNIAYLIYKEMIKQRPNYENKIKLIITKSNKDSGELLNLIPSDDEKTNLAIEFKKDNSNFNIAIVVDMWLTGFDVPDLDTLYLFKVIKWHNLMQTIARVNWTYKGKESGLVVDYIGIWKNISEALKQYAGKNEDTYNIEKVKITLLDLCLKIRKKYFEKNNIIYEWIASNNKNKFNKLIEGVNIIESLDTKNKDIFFALVSKISRSYKLCSTILEQPQKLEAQLYILIRNFIRNTKVEEAIDVEEMIKKLQLKMNDIIKTGDVEVNKVLLDGKRDLSYIYHLLEQELKIIQNNKKVDNLKIISLENQIKEQINLFRKTNPLKANSLSADLKKLIDKYSYDKNIEEYLEGIMKFAKIMIDQNNLAIESGIEDERVLSFYNVIADDKFKIKNQNSEILKEITMNIINIIKNDYTPQWYNNTKLRDRINSNIKKMLYTKYNYPPENAQEVSKIMIDEINKVVKINPEYFINKKEYYE